MADEPPIQPLVVPPGSVPPSQPVQPQPPPLASFSIPTNMVFGTSPSGPAPAIQHIQRNLLRNFGLADTPVDPMTGATAAPLSPFLEMVQKSYPGGRLPNLRPEFRGGIDPYPQAERAPITVDMTSILTAAGTGLDESPLGSLIRFGQMRNALGMHAQPGYDVWADRRIEMAGLGAQMHLFTGSQSADMTEWMIRRVQEKARMGEYIEGMGTPGAVARFAGGILGDPLTYLPATLGLKSTQLATRVAQGLVSGAEVKLLTNTGVFWGTIADTMANISLTAGTHVAGRLLEKSMDPAHQLDDVLDSLFLPVALAGASQFVTSAFTRYAAHGLKDAVRDPAFLRGHAASGARYVPDDFVGPVIHPDDEAAAALVSRYDRAGRRMERVDLGPTLPTREPLAGDSDYVAGKFGKQPEVPFNGLPRNGAFAPGSLATNYGLLRNGEALQDPATAAILKHNGIGPAPQPSILTASGRMADAADFRLDANITAADGTMWKIVGFNGKPVGWVPAPEVVSAASAATGGRGFVEPGSVGAALNPASQVYRREALLAQNRMAPTGIGMENLPLDPVSRTFQGLSVFAMQLVSDLVATGGRLTVGNLVGRTVGTRAPVEQLIEANWTKPVVDLVRRQHDAWHTYKKAMAKAGGQTDILPVDYGARTDMDRLAYEVGDSLKSMINRGDPGISFNAFRNRVAKALNNGDVDELTDAATSYVNGEASAQRAFYNRARDLGVQHKVFDEAYEKARDLALSEVRALKKEADTIARKSRLEKWDPARTRAAEEALIARTEDAQFRLRQTEEELKKLRDGGPSMNGTAPSYRPRIWDVGELTRLEHEFVPEISDWLVMKSRGTLDQAEAVRIAKEIHSMVSRQNPVYDRGDMEALFKSVASPGSAMARSLTIPDKLIEKYLINDSEVLLRYHGRQMGTAIEMKQRFGSLDLREQIAEIQQEYRGLIQRAKAGETGLPPVADLEKMMNGSIADMQVLRDRLYGTHGASADPHNWNSRTIRMAKQFANITLLGMSGISSLGDFIRPLMTEGLDAMYGYGLRSLMSDSRGTIMALSRKDMELAGTGMDLMNNVRALQAADIGDVFGSRGRLEHAMGQANQWMFVANGLNQLTEWSKRWSSIMIQGRMNNALMDLLEVGAVDAKQLSPRLAKFADHELEDLIKTSEHQVKRMESGAADVRQSQSVRDHFRDQAQQLRQGITEYERELQVRGGTAAGKIADPTDLARLASFNIDEVMGRRIALQLKIYGKNFDDLKLANLGEWTDKEAAELYKSMLFQSINRTVVTPGVGDRSTWMSTELGSLVSQYKAWGVANLIRSLQSGLQEGGNQFWYGAAGAVGFAIILNEVRSRLFYDHSTFDRPATAVIADGVDRSSILGWFSDANRAVEVLTGNRLGFRPLMGAVQSKPVDTVQAIGTLGGPAAGQGARAASVLNDFIRDHPTAKTYSNWRTLIPGNTLPYLDPVFDRAISDGNFRKSMDRSNERKRRLLQPADGMTQQ